MSVTVLAVSISATINTTSTMLINPSPFMSAAHSSSAEALSKDREVNVELYIKRWEKGLDLWTGKPLAGDGLRDLKGQKEIHKRFSNRDNAKRKRVAQAIKKVGVVRSKVRAYCEEHFQFSPSSNLISEIVTEIKSSNN